MVKKKAKNNHAKDYALGGGAVSTTAKVTAVPQCDVVELTVTRQPGHGELKGVSNEEREELQGLTASALQHAEWQRTNPALANTWEAGIGGRRIKHVLALVERLVGEYNADRGSEAETEEARSDALHAVWELCASEEWRPHIARSSDHAAKLFQLIFAVPLETKSIDVCKLALHAIWSLVSRDDELCQAAVKAGLVAALVAAANVVDGIVDLEPEVTSLWCRVLVSAFGDGSHEAPTALEAALCSEFVEVGGVICIVKLLETTNGHRDLFSLKHLLLLSLQCEASSYYPTLMLQKGGGRSLSLSELQTTSLAMTDETRGIAVMETSAPAIEEARTPAKEEGEEGEESSAEDCQGADSALLVRLMNRAPSAAAMIIAQLARSREGIACLVAFQATCPEKLGSFMNRCMRELVESLQIRKIRTSGGATENASAGLVYSSMGEPEPIEVVDVSGTICRFEIDQRDGGLLYSKNNKPIITVIIVDTKTHVFRKDEIRLILKGVPATNTEDAADAAAATDADVDADDDGDSGDDGTDLTSETCALRQKDVLQVLEGLRQFARAAEQSNLADHAILLRHGCIAWCACMYAQRAPFDAEIRELFDVSFDASSAYADYPPIDGTTVAVWDRVLGHATDDMLSTWATLVVLGTQLAELRLSGGTQHEMGVAWLYDESNRSNRVFTKLLLFVDPAKYTPEVVEAAAAALLNLVLCRRTVDPGSRSRKFHRPGLVLLLDVIGNVAASATTRGAYFHRGRKAMIFLSFLLVQLMGWRESEPETSAEDLKVMETVETLLRYSKHTKNIEVATYALCCLWYICRRPRGLALSAEKNMMQVVLTKLKEITDFSMYSTSSPPSTATEEESPAEDIVPDTCPQDHKQQANSPTRSDCQMWALAVIWLMVYKTKQRELFRACEYSYRLCVLIIRTASNEGTLAAAIAVATVLCVNDSGDTARSGDEATTSPKGKPWSATFKDKKWRPHHKYFGPLLSESLVQVVGNIEISARTRIRAVSLLQHLVKTSKRHGREILRCGLNCGILELYVKMLSEDGSEELQEHAAAEIARLTCEHPYREAALELGATDRIVQLLTDLTLRSSGAFASGSEVLQRETLLNALLNLSMESPHNQQLICQRSLKLLISLLMGTDFVDAPRDSAAGGADNVSISSHSVVPIPINSREKGLVEGILTNLKRSGENRPDLYLAQLAIATQSTGMDRGEKQSATTLESYARRSHTHYFHQLMRRSIYDSWSEQPNFNIEPQSTWGPVEVERGPKRKQVNTSIRAQGSRLWDLGSVGALAGDICLDVDPETGMERTRVLLNVAKSESQLKRVGSADLARYNFKVMEGMAGPRTEELAESAAASPPSRPQAAPSAVTSSSKVMNKKGASSTFAVGTMIRDHDKHRQRYSKRPGEMGTMAIWRSSGGPSSEGLFPKVHLADGSVFHAFHTEIPGEAAEEPPLQAALGPPLTFVDVTGCDAGFAHMPETRLFPFRENAEGSSSGDNEYDASVQFRALFETQLNPYFYAPKLRPAAPLTPPKLLSIPSSDFTLSITEDKIVTPRDAPSRPKPPGPPWDWKTKSIFVPRSKQEDGKGMEDFDLRNKAFEFDWRKCLEKDDRFLNLIKKGAQDDKDKDVHQVKQVLKSHYSWAIHVFKTFAASDETATNCSYMGWMSFGNLMMLSGVTDAESDACKQTHIDTIFKAANFDVTKGNGGHNPLEGLTRSEFIECIIRVGKAKFGKAGSMKHAVEAILKLMAETLTEDQICDEKSYHAFRTENLYVESTDTIYRKWESKLKALYESRVTKDVAMAKCWTLEMWKKFMEESNMFNESSFSR